MQEAQNIRNILKEKIPAGSIAAEHTATEHKYRINTIDKKPIFDSVTTKTGILNKAYLKPWAVKLAVNHIRDNMQQLLDPNTREGVLYDASQQSQDVLEDAGEVGHKVHGALELYINEWIIKGIRPLRIEPYIPQNETDARVICAIKSAEKFFNENHIIPIHSEMLVASQTMQVAGTMDFLCYIGTVMIKGGGICTHDFRPTEATLTYECAVCGETIMYRLGIIDWKTSNSIDHSEYALQVACYKGCVEESTGLGIEKLWIIRLDKKSSKYEKGVVLNPDDSLAVYRDLSKVYNGIQDRLLVIEGKDKKILNIEL